MASASIKGILNKIESLGDKDRLALERELTRKLEKEWQGQIGKVRQHDRQSVIDQAAIDRAIERRRYVFRHQCSCC